jgi:rare lipoprotein A
MKKKQQKMMLKYFLLTLILTYLAGCSSSSNPNSGRYSQHTDSAPSAIKDSIKFDNAKPIYEPYALANLRSYSVLGKQYTPLRTGKGYTATGGASWYGQKFHGHLTSNGETYDMYAMTAAHKTLPLPSYVKVTNLKNGREAIVRVNDRGPFHDNRIIDLSYAAAMKLGMLSTGTTQVKLEVIHIDEAGTQTVGNDNTVPPTPLKNDSLENDKVQISSASRVPPIGTTMAPTASSAVSSETTSAPATVDSQQPSIFIQIAALTNNQRINKIGNALASLYQVQFVAPLEEGLYRLRLGPFDSNQQATGILEQLRTTGYDDAYMFHPMN